MENTDKNENNQDGNIPETVGQPERANPRYLINKLYSDGKEKIYENFETVNSFKLLSNEIYKENMKLTDKHEKEEIAKDEFVDVDVKVEIFEEEPNGKGDQLNLMDKVLAAEIKKEFYKRNREMLDFKCQECLKIFKKERYLKMHIKEVHMKAQMSICNLCSKEFKSFHLKRHIKNVHIKEECSCDECGKVYTNRKHLRDHKKAVHEGLDLLCHLCCKSFTSKSYLSNHIRRFHNAIDEELICDYCSKLFQSQNKLYLHIKAVHTIENLPCHECGKIYKNSYLLRKHIKKYHSFEQNSELAHSRCVMQSSKIQKTEVLPNSEAILSTEVTQQRNVVQNSEAILSTEVTQQRNVVQNIEAAQSRTEIHQHSAPASMNMEMAEERDEIKTGSHKSDFIPYAKLQNNIDCIAHTQLPTKMLYDPQRISSV